MGKSKPKPTRGTRVRRPKPDRARFAQEYLVDLNATEAAIRCGYSPKTARSQGSRLLTSEDIAPVIKAAMDARAQQTGVTADRVLTELGHIALSDIRQVIHVTVADSVTAAIEELPESATRAIAEVQVETYLEGGGEDAKQVKRVKLKLHPKVPAINLAMQHLGMLTERSIQMDPKDWTDEQLARIANGEDPIRVLAATRAR